MENEPFFEQVAAEIGSKDIRPGLWAMAFAEAVGDIEVARALYIKFRVAQLVKEDELAAFESTEEADEAANEAMRQEDRAAWREYDREQEQKRALRRRDAGRIWTVLIALVGSWFAVYAVNEGGGSFALAAAIAWASALVVLVRTGN